MRALPLSLPRVTTEIDSERLCNSINFKNRQTPCQKHLLPQAGLFVASACLMSFGTYKIRKCMIYLKTPPPDRGGPWLFWGHRPTGRHVSDPHALCLHLERSQTHRKRAATISKHCIMNIPSTSADNESNTSPKVMRKIRQQWLMCLHNSLIRVVTLSREIVGWKHWKVAA